MISKQKSYNVDLSHLEGRPYSSKLSHNWTEVRPIQMSNKNIFSLFCLDVSASKCPQKQATRLTGQMGVLEHVCPKQPLS